MLVGPRYSRIWLALTLAAAAAGLSAALMVLLGGGDWEWRSGFSLGGEPLHLRLDGISALFLVLLCVVGGAGAVYSREYWSDHHYPDSAPRGRAWWSALLLSMGLGIDSVQWSALSHRLGVVRRLRLFPDHAGPRQRAKRGRRAGCIWRRPTPGPFVSSHSLPCWRRTLEAGNSDRCVISAGLAPLFWLALFGFGVKAGFFPLHIWLPSAHANAPSHVSAIMSGVAIKMGIYGIVRFSGWLPVPPAAGWVVIGLGAISALLGIAFAFAQNDFKRLLAYCSVENMGVILIGVGGALLAVTSW